MTKATTIVERFRAAYGAIPTLVVRAPGRVNLIGEHTDYNDGFVFPAAIDRATYVAARPVSEPRVRVLAADLGLSDTFDITDITRSSDQPWSNYVRGVVRGLRVAGHAFGGADLVVSSDVPRGAGLSSSAALEVAIGYTFQTLYNLNLLGEELALLAQGAENTFVGVQCGIMDQFISVFGQQYHALLIDCRDLSFEAVPLPPSAAVVICDSGVRHEHGTSGYNERRSECERAVALLRPVLRGITALRDVSQADLAAHGHLLDATVLRRARHVVSENARVLASVQALHGGDVAHFGTLMNESHVSMRDDYSITVPAIDTLVTIAQALPGCYGSRMTGGGFGGCTVSLVEVDAATRFGTTLATRYQQETGRTAAIHLCMPANGVGRVL